MKNVNFKYQKIFPSYKLSWEEIEWINVFVAMAGFDPIGTEDVKSQKDFLEMIEKNEEHCLACAHEAVEFSTRAKNRLSYSLDFI
jgi:hypothetical protein